MNAGCRLWPGDWKGVLAAVGAVGLAACSDGAQEQRQQNDAQSAPVEAVVAQPMADAAQLAAMRAQFAPVEMTPDISFLSAEERDVIALLMQVGDLMSAIYLRQRNEENPAIRQQIADSPDAGRDALLTMFDLHFGPWDSLGDYAPFYGSAIMPPGAGFYPSDITREEFETWLAAYPEDEEAFKSPYSVIRRDGDRLVAIPYSVQYQEFLEPAAQLLEEAAEITSDENLKRFLSLRAQSLLSDRYFDSEMAWMDLNGTIEVAIGPYEVYTDRLFGLKTAFEIFVTVKDPQKSAALAKYKSYLRDMEENLPVAERYKNFRRGFESPIVVADQLRGGGDNVPGVQTIAFNLPNDEKVREAKGAKKVILSNVLGAKFDRILQPMASKVLVSEQAGLLKREHMANETLFHELSHSLGPGAITVDGKETTVSAVLQELYTPLEESKADVMGAYNVLYMMERGELPVAEKESFLATYFVGLFRAMRFGTGSAHGGGAAIQYQFFKEAEAFAVEQGRLKLDFSALESAISALTARLVEVQGDGDYAAAKAFLNRYAKADDTVTAIIASMSDLPVDIQPIYPDASSLAGGL